MLPGINVGLETGKGLIISNCCVKVPKTKVMSVRSEATYASQLFALCELYQEEKSILDQAYFLLPCRRNLKLPQADREASSDNSRSRS